MCYACIMMARYLSENKDRISRSSAVVKRVISENNTLSVPSADVLKELESEGIEADKNFLDIVLQYGMEESYEVNASDGLLQKAQSVPMHSDMDDWDWN